MKHYVKEYAKNSTDPIQIESDAITQLFLLVIPFGALAMIGAIFVKRIPLRKGAELPVGE